MFWSRKNITERKQLERGRWSRTAGTGGRQAEGRGQSHRLGPGVCFHYPNWGVGERGTGVGQAGGAGEGPRLTHAHLYSLLHGDRVEQKNKSLG